MSISHQFIKYIKIIKLKQLENVKCSFEGHNLTAILGINGCGKSTILHALACCYQPLNTGQDYKFSDFFLPNNFNIWDGSKFFIEYSFEDKGIKRKNIKLYKKIRIDGLDI
jgi:energy-coupling factor transporter ATP-binding protein EcfA2